MSYFRFVAGRAESKIREVVSGSDQRRNLMAFNFLQVLDNFGSGSNRQRIHDVRHLAHTAKEARDEVEGDIAAVDRVKRAFGHFVFPFHHMENSQVTALAHKHNRLIDNALTAARGITFSRARSLAITRSLMP